MANAMSYVVVLLHSDRSGILQTFGPYPSEEAATEARERLQQSPAIRAGVWEIHPCTRW